MKLIQAIIRPEKVRTVLKSLGKAGFHAFTKWEGRGRGRQKGIQVGPVHYQEISKVWLMIAVEDDEAVRAVEILKFAAQTGNPGDGKIFTSSLVQSRTIRDRG